MSETETEPDEKEKKKVEPKNPDPVLKSKDLFDWLEPLFNGEDQFPERIDVRVVTGRHGERLGPMIHQYIYKPAEYAPTPSANGRPKPGREALVKLANEVMHRCQRDCDQQRRRVTYSAMACHFSREADFYARFLIDLQPGGTYRYDKDGKREVEDPGYEFDDEGGRLPVHERFSGQALQHNKDMFEMYAIATGAIMERYERILNNQEIAIKERDSRIASQNDVIERALSLEEERKAKREWRELGVKMAEKAGNMGLDLAPPLVNHLIGKSVLPVTSSPEQVTLKNFFRLVKDGGQLTSEQADAVFGVWAPEPPHAMIKAGVLNLEQGQLLYRISEGQVPPEKIDDLLPGGPLQISFDQFQKITSSCGLSIDQLMPLQMLFESRMKIREQAAKDAAAKDK